MSQSPDNFDALQKLLALKRHEPPPPGYFNRFAGQVIARLEAEGGVPSPTWWQRWWEALNAPPVLALSYGAVIVGLVMLGTGLLQSLELDADPALAASQPWLARDSISVAAVAPPRAEVLLSPAVDPAGPASSFSPVLGNSAPPFLFNPSGLRVERVSYQPR
jgi:hypothetical protein